MIALASALLVGAASAAPILPNLIILMADDYGKGDMSPPLGVSPALTPNLNAIAASSNGAVFERFYSSGPVCSPTRATVLTGRTSTRDCILRTEQMSLPLQIAGATVADYAKAAGYDTFFAGKWHLGSNTNDTSSASCYHASATNGTCLPGYIPQKAPVDPSLCCDGRDATLVQRTPLDFGFNTVFATSQVAPSSTSNCGCLQTVPGAGEGCNLGHYAASGHSPAWVPGLECDQTWWTRPGDGVWAPYKNLTAVDDAEMLVDHLEAFVNGSVAAGKPFLAQVSFHQVHIPYISPPQFRSLYAQYNLNEQDYYGAITAMDAQVGRVRQILAAAGVADNTMIIFTADNGPEVDNSGGHETTPFVNPGLTGGLTGRKRALTEGGIRVAGIVEAPFLVRGQGPLHLQAFAAATVDILPTFMELINATNVRPSWPLDGISLVSALSGGATVRPQPIGWLSDFTLASGNATCPSGPPKLPPNAPANYSTPVKQPQVAWSEGNLKLVGCMNEGGHWRFRLFDVVADRGETNDLFDANLPTVSAMFGRLAQWQASVQNSWDTESVCQSQPRTL